MSETWLTDTAPSLPEPPPKPPAVDLGGFVFTAGGIGHPITRSRKEELLLSAYTPLDRLPEIAQNIGIG